MGPGVGRTIFVAYLLFFASNRAFSTDETGSITGRVLIEGEGRPVGANIVLLETRFGTTANDEGRFVMRSVPVGTYLIQARLVGYEAGPPVSVTVRANLNTSVGLSLLPSAVELAQVTVFGSGRQMAEDTRSSLTSITPRESKVLPGAAEDVLRSLQSLPGVTAVSDFSAQLVVRGSGPDQNLILIDDFEVLNPYRLYGFVSMFNPETLHDISLQTGGFGAQYGDRLSAVLDVRNREGRNDVPLAGKVNASLTNLNLIVEGGLPINGASYLFSARRTYYDLIVGPILKSMRLVQGDVALPNFRDLQGRIAMPLGGSHRLLFSLFFSRDGVDLVSGADRDRPDSVNVSDVSYNNLIGLTWQFNPSKDLLTQTQVSWYRNDGRGEFDGTFVDPTQNNPELSRLDTFGIRLFKIGVDYAFRYEKISLSHRVLWYTGRHVLEAGVGFDRLRTDMTSYIEYDEILVNIAKANGFILPYDVTESIYTNRFNIYMQERIALSERLFIQPGLRFDIFPTLGRPVYVSPRINASYEIDEVSTIRAAYGLYVQSPGMEKQDFRRPPLVYTEGTFDRLFAEVAYHWVLGYDRLLSPEWQFKVETYYKKFNDLIVGQKQPGTVYHSERTGKDIYSPEGWTTPVAVEEQLITNTPINDSKGQSYGIEFVMQKIRALPSDKFTGWISYGLSFAERERDGVKTPFQFDQRHALNIVGNYKFADRWDLGVRYTLRSGRPQIMPVELRPRITTQTTNGVTSPVFVVDSQGKLILDNIYEMETISGRLNTYHSMDVRLTTYPQWWGLQWSVYLDIHNLFNRKNEEQKRYYLNEDGSYRERPIYGIPFFPSLGLSVSF